jgi:exosortase
MKFLDKSLALLCFGSIAYLFFPTLREIAEICWNDDDYSHGTLLPAVAAYMIWDSKETISKRITNAYQNNRQKEFSIILPWLVLVFGLAVFFLGEATDISFTCWFAFFPVILSSIYLIYGKTTFYNFAPPILLLFMAKPLPDSLVVRLFWPLQVMAAKVSKDVLSALSVPVYLSGNIIEIPGMRLMVEEACSGMRSVMAMITLSLIVSYFMEMRIIYKIILVIFSLFVAIVLNVFRVATTGILAYFYDPASASGFFHTFSGLVVFVIGLPLLYGAGYVLQKIDGGKK